MWTGPRLELRTFSINGECSSNWTIRTTSQPTQFSQTSYSCLHIVDPYRYPWDYHLYFITDFWGREIFYFLFSHTLPARFAFIARRIYAEYPGMLWTRWQYSSEADPYDYCCQFFSVNRDSKCSGRQNFKVIFCDYRGRNKI